MSVKTAKSPEFASVPYKREPGMSEEIAYYDEELTELIRSIEVTSGRN